MQYPEKVIFILNGKPVTKEEAIEHINRKRKHEYKNSIKSKGGQHVKSNQD